MERILFAPAKINLFLEITGKKPDGYHTLSSLFVKVNLCDRIKVERGQENIEFTCSDPRVPADGSNTIFKALNFLKKEGLNIPPLKIHLEKHIPSGSGLGGASSDSAEIIKYLAGGKNLPFQKLAYEVGGDVPFFLQPSPSAWVEGIGEIVRPVSIPRLFFILIIPPFSISTKWAYEEVDKVSSWEPRIPHQTSFLPWNEIEKLIFNRFLEILSRVHQSLKGLTDELKKNMGSVPWSMSGSGSAFFAVLPEKKERDRLFEHLENRIPACKIIKVETFI